MRGLGRALPASNPSQGRGLVKTHTQAAEQPRDLASLRRLLDEGWQIEPPVLARPARDGRAAYDYHFILARGTQRDLAVLPECDTVREFCVEHELVVALPAPPLPRRRARDKAPTSAL
jgi:hypothetical protein